MTVIAVNIYDDDNPWISGWWVIGGMYHKNDKNYDDNADADDDDPRMGGDWGKPGVVSSSSSCCSVPHGQVLFKILFTI